MSALCKVQTAFLDSLKNSVHENTMWLSKNEFRNELHARLSLKSVFSGCVRRQKWAQRCDKRQQHSINTAVPWSLIKTFMGRWWGYVLRGSNMGKIYSTFCPHSVFVNKANLVHNFPLYVYFFSLHVSGDYVPIIRRNNCICATLDTCHSVWMTAYQTVNHTEWQVPSVAQIQLFLLMMGT